MVLRNLLFAHFSPASDIGQVIFSHRLYGFVIVSLKCAVQGLRLQ